MNKLVTAGSNMFLRCSGKCIADLATVMADDNSIGETSVLQCAENY